MCCAAGGGEGCRGQACVIAAHEQGVEGRATRVPPAWPGRAWKLGDCGVREGMSTDGTCPIFGLRGCFPERQDIILSPRVHSAPSLSGHFGSTRDPNKKSPGSRTLTFRGAKL
eukprot:2588979-Rhodomonas_salina.3